MFVYLGNTCLHLSHREHTVEEKDRKDDLKNRL